MTGFDQEDTTPSLRALRPEDAAAVLAIYQDGIETGDATFAEAAPDWPGFDQQHLDDCRLVAVIENRVVGWAALAPTSMREVYRGVAEVSVYVAADARGLSIGRRLLTALINASEAAGIWTLQAGIFPENLASIALHQAAGFTLIGLRERLGRMTYGRHAGKWRDVALLERRSTVAGMD